MLYDKIVHSFFFCPLQRKCCVKQEPSNKRLRKNGVSFLLLWFVITIFRAVDNFLNPRGLVVCNRWSTALPVLFSEPLNFMHPAIYGAELLKRRQIAPKKSWKRNILSELQCIIACWCCFNSVSYFKRDHVWTYTVEQCVVIHNNTYLWHTLHYCAGAIKFLIWYI